VRSGSSPFGIDLSCDSELEFKSELKGGEERGLDIPRRMVLKDEQIVLSPSLHRDLPTAAARFFEINPKSNTLGELEDCKVSNSVG